MPPHRTAAGFLVAQAQHLGHHIGAVERFAEASGRKEVGRLVQPRLRPVGSSKMAARRADRGVERPAGNELAGDNLPAIHGQGSIVDIEERLHLTFVGLNNRVQGFAQELQQLGIVRVQEVEPAVVEDPACVPITCFSPYAGRCRPPRPRSDSQRKMIDDRTSRDFRDRGLGSSEGSS